MPRLPKFSKKTKRLTSVLLSLVLAVPLAFALGWLIDDVAFGHDIPRGVVVAGIDIGGTDRETAETRLTESSLGDRPIELTWAGHSLMSSSSELGVGIDTEATLGLADDRGDTLSRPIRWMKSFFTDRTIEPVMVIDNSALDDLFTTGAGSAFGVEFGLPDVELTGGEFVAVSRAIVPQVDIEALDRLLLEAAVSPNSDNPPIEVPTLGDQLVDDADSQLAELANDLSDGGISVSLVGSANSFHIPQPTLRSWIEFAGTRQQPEINLDQQAVMDVLTSLFVGFGESGEEPGFVVDSVGGVRIVGGAPGSVCCEADTIDKILDALDAGSSLVELRPQEDPDAKGLAWAESLEIHELVGEFTTNFKPGQTRVTNIDRIAELTRGAIIEPGETFSINEFVGRRTREKGFVSAGVISNGVFSSSVGGGISQYATTLFNAAFFAGLDFGEYQSHSIYISRYPYGREATMSFPHPDLQITNNTPFGVLLWPTTTATSITVSLYSTKWVFGEQTGQTRRGEGVSCTRVNTERTRTWVEDGRTEVDTVTARYRPEGVSCGGGSSVPTTSTAAPPTTSTPPTTSAPPTTTVPPATTTVPATTTTAPPTTVPATTTTAPP